MLQLSPSIGMISPLFLFVDNFLLPITHTHKFETDISPVSMKSSSPMLFNMQRDGEMNELTVDTFHNTESNFENGGWKTGYWKSKYCSR